jgi:tryptophan halogenase
MNSSPQHIVILGGGTAGWLTAGILAAEFDTTNVTVTLVESPTVPTIGVGEGTWPSMRSTLLKIGLSERVFIEQCSSALKQGTQFKNWLHGNGETYYHPFTLPHGFAEVNLAEHWNRGHLGNQPFASSVTPQFAVCEAGLAPKQLSVPEYAFTLNYGYHLDAGKFATMLSSHATEQLGVRHVLADVSGVASHDNGDIASLITDQGPVTGDLFVDCSGFRSVLLGDHYGVPFVSQKHVLFNDSALAVQVPYGSSSEIATTTKSTAHQAGWIWDIGLQHRRGVGAVFSSDHASADSIEPTLDAYLRETGHSSGLTELEPRLIRFDPGYRKFFWHKNCVAVGLSAGFIEPLEASALVLVELSARSIAQQLPKTRQQMDTVAQRFNTEFSQRWEQIIEFLKLHYVLSQREDTAYWREHRDAASVPSKLAEKLADWRHRCPWHLDERRVDEMFPSASYQYVLYGMNFKSDLGEENRRLSSRDRERARMLKDEIDALSSRYLQHLPRHRSLISEAIAQGFAT